MGEKRMRSKWIIRIWLGRLTRYLVVPLVFCVILFPLYGLMHQQTEKAQLTDAAEQLATAVSTFEGYLSDLRFTTNKLFNDDSYKLLAVSDDDSLMGDYMTSFNASTLLQDLTYSMSYTAYSYVTFARNHFVIDPYRVFSGARSPKTSHSTCAVSAPGATERERATAPLRYHVSLLSRSDK